MPKFNLSASTNFNLIKASDAGVSNDFSLDLNQFLVKHPAATYFIRIQGDAMQNIGIHENDIAIVDRSLPPSKNQIIIAELNGELIIRRMEEKNGRTFLLPENDTLKPHAISPDDNFSVWGSVTGIIRKY